jgi:hypothetical protein
MGSLNEAMARRALPTEALRGMDDLRERRAKPWRLITPWYAVTFLRVLVDWKASTGMPSAVRQAVTHTVFMLPLGRRM